MAGLRRRATRGARGSMQTQRNGALRMHRRQLGRMNRIERTQNIELPVVVGRCITQHCGLNIHELFQPTDSPPQKHTRFLKKSPSRAARRKFEILDSKSHVPTSHPFEFRISCLMTGRAPSGSLLPSVLLRGRSVLSLHAVGQHQPSCFGLPFIPLTREV